MKRSSLIGALLFFVILLCDAAPTHYDKDSRLIAKSAFTSVVERYEKFEGFEFEGLFGLKFFDGSKMEFIKATCIMDQEKIFWSCDPSQWTSKEIDPFDVIYSRDSIYFINRAEKRIRFYAKTPSDTSNGSNIGGFLSKGFNIGARDIRDYTGRVLSTNNSVSVNFNTPDSVGVVVRYPNGNAYINHSTTYSIDKQVPHISSIRDTIYDNHGKMQATSLTINSFRYLSKSFTIADKLRSYQGYTREYMQ